MSDDRGSVYAEGDRVYYRASGLGKCIRALVGARLGYSGEEPDSFIRGVMEEGNLHEQDVIERLAEDEGWLDTGRGQEEIELHVPGTNCYIRGHIDGVVDRSNGDGGWLGIPHVLEVKSMSDAAYKRWLRRGFEEYPGYAWQISVYMHALGLPALYAVKNRNNGQMTTMFLHEAPIPLFKITERIVEVEEWVKRNGEAFPACEPGGSWHCPFSFLHDGYDPEAKIGKVTKLNDPDLDALLRAYDQARFDEDAARARKEELRDDIERAMLTDTIETPMFKVQLREQKSVRVDNGLVRKLLGKRFHEAQVESVSRYLIVTPKNK